MSTNTLIELDQTGHIEMHWDSDNTDEAGEARRTFDRLRAKGYAATRPAEGGGRETIHSFEEARGDVVMQPATAGG